MLLPGATETTNRPGVLAQRSSWKTRELSRSPSLPVQQLICFRRARKCSTKNEIPLPIPAVTPTVGATHYHGKQVAESSRLLKISRWEPGYAGRVVIFHFRNDAAMWLEGFAGEREWIDNDPVHCHS